MQEELFHQIVLTRIPQIGNIIAQHLINHFGNAVDIFKASVRELSHVAEVGESRAYAIKKFKALSEVEQEIRFLEQHNIQVLCCNSPQYPQRLLHCNDRPFLLYFKGNADLNAGKIVNIIGTRTPGDYGREMCKKIVEGLAPYNITVVSGLAYGIDILAHETALKQQLPTIGVVAHGLDRIYPSAHTAIARQMLDAGGILTEYHSGTAPDKANFPKRNRIVAGISDATILIESNVKGGSMITADIAGSYNRDIFAVPGRVGDPNASGCHHLIKTNQAMLVTGAADILQAMGWEQAARPKPHPQQELFVTLSPEEQEVLALFSDHTEQHVDEICRQSSLPGSKVASLVLQLEMQHLVKSTPGQKYVRY